MSNAAAVFGDTPDTVEPVTGGNRLANLDLIRGIAVLGILAANIVFFGQPMMAYMWPEGFVSEAGDPDYWMWIAQYVLIDGKMRGLFTLLFGVGLSGAAAQLLLSAWLKPMTVAVMVTK